jgi:4-hydroxythreonine-4-phosphate dehydrogenase
MEKPRIGVSALNPHAGEGGLFGREEIDEIEPAIAQARAEGVDAIGPVPPDTVFFKTKQGMFDLTVALYHDAGLGAVKLLGFGTVVTLLAGLPFIRTSTGHGTAFDIAGKGIADHKNLLGAIKVAAELGAGRLGPDPARAAAGR